MGLGIPVCCLLLDSISPAPWQAWQVRPLPSVRRPLHAEHICFIDMPLIIPAIRVARLGTGDQLPFSAEQWRSGARNLQPFLACVFPKAMLRAADFRLRRFRTAERQSTPQ